MRVAVEHQRAVVALVRNNVNYSNYNGAAGTGLFFKARDWSAGIAPAKWHVVKTNAFKRGIAFEVSKEV